MRTLQEGLEKLRYDEVIQALSNGQESSSKTTQSGRGGLNNIRAREGNNPGAIRMLENPIGDLTNDIGKGVPIALGARTCLGTR